MTFKINENHYMALIDFMENHKNFARGQFTGPTGKSAQKRLWGELSSILNSLGGGVRPVEKWQKFWADTKYSLKKKAAAIRLSMGQTGGGPPLQKNLNHWEERILAILSKTFNEGVGSTECGLSEHIKEGNVSVVTTEVLTDVISIPSTSKVPIPSTSKVSIPSTPRARSPLEHVSDHDYEPLTKKKKKSQLEIENDLCQETISELREIKENVIGINHSLSSISETLKDLKNHFTNKS